MRVRRASIAAAGGFAAAAITARTRLLLIGAALVCVATSPALAPAQDERMQHGETVVVEPAGVTTLDDMVAAEARAARAPVAAPRAVPFMRVPPVGDIGMPSSGAPLAAPAAPVASAGGAGSLAPTVTTSFQALSDDNSTIPPDTQGAVGPSHVVTMVNSQVHVQDKSGGNVRLVSLSTFWTSGTGLSGSPYDPHVTYDSISGRWIAACSADGESATSKLFFAISATNDPTGTWTFYSLTADGTGMTWGDYPALGVNSTWVAITQNMYTVSGDSFAGAKMWVIDKSTALAGGALTITVFNPGFESGPCGGSPPCGGTLVPAVTFSAAEATLYLVDNPGFTSGGTQLIRLSRITGTGPAPSWSAVPGSSFSGTGFFAVANNFDFPFAMITAPQKNVTATCNGGTNNGGVCSSDANCPPGPPVANCRLIDTGDTRIINVVNRNGRLWFAHAGGVPVGAVDRTAAFWYQVNPAAMPAPIVQSGVMNGGAGVHHMFPSITANTSNDAVLGFSRADATRFAEAVYTSRSGTDPLGAMNAITVLKAGEDVYLKDFGSHEIRWGDYSATVIDPSDDTTFWTIQEYATLSAGSNTNPFNNRWGLWWGKLSMGPTATPSSTPTRTPTAMPTVTTTPTPTVTPTMTPQPPANLTLVMSSCAARVDDICYGIVTAIVTTDMGQAVADGTVVNVVSYDGLANPSSPEETAVRSTCGLELFESACGALFQAHGVATACLVYPVSNEGESAQLSGVSGAASDTKALTLPACVAAPTATVAPTATATPTPSATPGCGVAPEADCRTPAVPGKATLVLKENATDDTKNTLAWNWAKGSATARTEFGDPTTATAYDLCVYDGTPTLILSASIPPGGLCGTLSVKPCWKPTRSGFSYSNRAATPDGVQKLALAEGLTAGHAKISASGKGANLAMPVLPIAVPAGLPLIVQLKNTAGVCWEATYSAPTKNDAGQFRARSD